MHIKHTAKAPIAAQHAQSVRIAIIRTSYYTDLIDNLEESCRATLIQNGVKAENITTFTAPGSWELPLLAKAAATSGSYDAIIAFGIIVKGQTHHFQMIADNVGRALMDISLAHTIPVALEVLAVYSLAHAKARASKNEKNKGIEAATAALAQLSELKKVRG